MKILFMGHQAFAVPSLEALVNAGHEVCGVFTQPDKPKNRKKLLPTPVKECALSYDIPVFQPAKNAGRRGDGSGQAACSPVSSSLRPTEKSCRRNSGLPKYGCVNVIPPCSRLIAAPRLSTGRCSTATQRQALRSWIWRWNWTPGISFSRAAPHRPRRVGGGPSRPSGGPGRGIAASGTPADRGRHRVPHTAG
jgi:hypothetical protein